MRIRQKKNFYMVEVKVRMRSLDCYRFGLEPRRKKKNWNESDLKRNFLLIIFGKITWTFANLIEANETTEKV